MTFAVAMKQYFGIKEGQTLKDFQDEIRKLTVKDREDFTGWLEKELGITIVPYQPTV